MSPNQRAAPPGADVKKGTGTYGCNAATGECGDIDSNRTRVLNASQPRSGGIAIPKLRMQLAAALVTATVEPHDEGYAVSFLYALEFRHPRAGL